MGLTPICKVFFMKDKKVYNFSSINPVFHALWTKRWFINIVDFRFKRTLSAGRAVSLLGRFAICGVSPVPLIPLESPPSTTINEVVNIKKIYQLLIAKTRINDSKLNQPIIVVAIYISWLKRRSTCFAVTRKLKQFLRKASTVAEVNRLLW